MKLSNIICPMDHVLVKNRTKHVYLRQYSCYNRQSCFTGNWAVADNLAVVGNRAVAWVMEQKITKVVWSDFNDDNKR